MEPTPPPVRQTFVVTLATDGDVQGQEILDVLTAVGYHVVELSQPVLRSVENPSAFYCPKCESMHEPPLHQDDITDCPPYIHRHHWEAFGPIDDINPHVTVAPEVFDGIARHLEEE